MSGRLRDLPTRHSELVQKLKEASLFTFRSVEAAVGRNYAKVLIHNLRRKGQIVELLKGVYSFKKSPYMVAKALPRAYVGLGSAAFLHGAWNQVTAVTILSPDVSRIAKHGVREVAGFKVVLRKISSKMYFGYEYKYLGDLREWVRVSDPEKTLIDIIYFRYPASDDIIPGLLEIIDTNKIRKYIEILKERSVKGQKKIEERINSLIKVKSR